MRLNGERIFLTVSCFARLIGSRGNVQVIKFFFLSSLRSRHEHSEIFYTVLKAAIKMKDQFFKYAIPSLRSYTKVNDQIISSTI